jgi:hypothetical protein
MSFLLTFFLTVSLIAGRTWAKRMWSARQGPFAPDLDRGTFGPDTESAAGLA